MTPEKYLSTVLPWVEGDKRERDLYLCKDCGLHTLKMNHYYHVNNDIWLNEAGNPKGHLCLPCLEKKISRPLTPNDFSSAPINMAAALHSDSAAIRILGKNFVDIRSLVERWFLDYFHLLNK